MITVMGSSNDETGKGLGRWFAEKTNTEVHSPFSAIGFLDNTGTIKGVATFSNYNGYNIEMHWYGYGCISKKNFKFILAYIFNELGCIRLTVLPPRNNKTILKIIPRLNFTYETILKNYYGPRKQDDAIVYRMTSVEASKWIKVNGIQFRPEAAASTIGSGYSSNI